MQNFFSLSVKQILLLFVQNLYSVERYFQYIQLLKMIDDMF